jgi:hypothetical protein
MDRLWYKKVSSSSVQSAAAVLTSSAVRRDTVDGIVRDTFSIRSSSVSNSCIKRGPMTNVQTKPADEIPVCAEYD